MGARFIFFQSLGKPGQDTDYICFTATSKSEAEKIGNQWLDWKSGLQQAKYTGSRLLSKAEAQRWYAPNGVPIFQESRGCKSFLEFKQAVVK